MHFPHRIRITRSVPHPDPETDDYGQPLPGFEPTELVLYDGAADVQDKPALLIRDLAGDPTIDADTAVFLPTVGAVVTDPFRLVENGDVVETPIGDGTVQGRRHLDRQLFIRLDH